MSPLRSVLLVLALAAAAGLATAGIYGAHDGVVTAVMALALGG